MTYKGRQTKTYDQLLAGASYLHSDVHRSIPGWTIPLHLSSTAISCHLTTYYNCSYFNVPVSRLTLLRWPNKAKHNVMATRGFVLFFSATVLRAVSTLIFFYGHRQISQYFIENIFLSLKPPATQLPKQSDYYFLTMVSGCGEWQWEPINGLCELIFALSQQMFRLFLNNRKITKWILMFFSSFLCWEGRN